MIKVLEYGEKRDGEREGSPKANSEETKGTVFETLKEKIGGKGFDKTCFLGGEELWAQGFQLSPRFLILREKGFSNCELNQLANLSPLPSLPPTPLPSNKQTTVPTPNPSSPWLTQLPSIYYNFLAMCHCPLFLFIFGTQHLNFEALIVLGRGIWGK